MASKIIYPKPLPQLIKQNFPLETGFTPTEIVALQNGWCLIKRRLNYHSAKIFTDFFSENYFLLERFRNVEIGKFNLSNLHQHPAQLMNIYGSLIESGLNDVAFINMLLSDVGQRHQLYEVTYDDVKLYVIEFLDKVKSTTFLNGLTKLSELINEHHRVKAEDEEQTARRQSDDTN
ncbi:uncharacterized protein LOC119603366 isoform X2 [Lucilia sericata]|uniref:uncharacterized protein LOC119603366 isoform X2 n=1 Tax=Lucilia sericata TaxID=13632 RepID=UPI0018A8408A|nr:uncharacterized protein LOC119603366 isoform X2 [Lucilia sericata]